jgi:hypothetical protein
MIKVRCGKCGQTIGAPDKYAGKTVACPKCKANVQIPQSSQQAQVRPLNIIKFHCPNCNQKIGLASEYAGKQVRCAKCKNTMLVPLAASISPPVQPAEKPADDFNPFDDNLLNFDALKQAEQDAPAADMPMRLAPADEPTQQSEFANMVGRSPSLALESAGARGNSMPFKIDSTPIALLASIIFVIFGGMAWGLIAKYTDRQFGMAAWGIGVLAGLGVYLFTANRGTFLGVLVALIAFFGILSGKYFVAKWYFMPQLMAEFREKGPIEMFDPNNVSLTDEQIKKTIAKPRTMLSLAAMQLADDAKITKEDAVFYVRERFNRASSENNSEDPPEVNEVQAQANELRYKQVETQAYKCLAEWDEQKKAEVVRAQYPKMMKEFADVLARNKVVKMVGFIIAYIATFSLFDLVLFPIAMVTAYKFGTGESS